jgi:hypothetical protein
MGIDDSMFPQPPPPAYVKLISAMDPRVSLQFILAGGFAGLDGLHQTCVEIER